MTTIGSLRKEGELEDILLCSLCEELLEDAKILECRHRFCKRCLTGVIDDVATDATALCCPHCQREQNLPGDGIEGIPGDLCLDEILRNKKIERDLKNSKKEQVCSACEKLLTTVAICPHCGGFLCDACFSAHGTMRIFKSHADLVTLDDIETGRETFDGHNISSYAPKPKCSLHEDMILRIHCKTCNLLICSLCESVYHQSHKIEDIGAAGTRANTRILELIEGSKRKENVLQERAAYITGLRKKYETVIREITEQAEDRATNLEESIKKLKCKDLQDLEDKRRMIEERAEEKLDEVNRGREFIIDETVLMKAFLHQFCRDAENETQGALREVRDYQAIAKLVTDDGNNWSLLRAVSEIEESLELGNELEKDSVIRSWDRATPSISDLSSSTLKDLCWSIHAGGSTSGQLITDTQYSISQIFDISGAEEDNTLLVAAVGMSWSTGIEVQLFLSGVDCDRMKRVSLSKLEDVPGIKRVLLAGGDEGHSYTVCVKSDSSSIYRDAVLIDDLKLPSSVICCVLLSSGGGLLVGLENSVTLYKCNLEAAQVSTVAIVEDNLQPPVSLAVAADGTILLCDGKSKAVAVSHHGKVTSRFQRRLLTDEPLRVSTDRKGFVYILWMRRQMFTSVVMQYSPKGTLISEIPVSRLSTALTTMVIGGRDVVVLSDSLGIQFYEKTCFGEMFGQYVLHRDDPDGYQPLSVWLEEWQEAPTVQSDTQEETDEDPESTDNECSLTTDIEVKITQRRGDPNLLNRTGVIREIHGPVCSVVLDGDEVVAVDGKHLEPIKPARGDKIKIISGKYQGNTGLLHSVEDGLAGVVSLDSAPSDFKIQAMDLMAKHYYKSFGHCKGPVGHAKEDSPSDQSTQSAVAATGHKGETGGLIVQRTLIPQPASSVVSTIALTSAPMQTDAKPLTTVVSAVSGSKTSTVTTSPIPVNKGSVLSAANKRATDEVNKCKNFLNTLIRLASNGNQPPATVQNVKDLVKNVIDGAIQPGEFTRKIQGELKSAPQPHLVPFLEKNLPSLRQLIQRDGISPIQGITLNILAGLPLPSKAIASSTSSIASSLKSPMSLAGQMTPSQLEKSHQGPSKQSQLGPGATQSPKAEGSHSSTEKGVNGASLNEGLSSGATGNSSSQKTENTGSTQILEDDGIDPIQHAKQSYTVFQAPPGTDTEVKNGREQEVNTRHQVISAMEQCKHKSIEEIRLDDYHIKKNLPSFKFNFSIRSNPGADGRGVKKVREKVALPSEGQTNTQMQQGGLFGSAAKPAFGQTTKSSLFGSTPGTNLFGQSTQAKTALFGQTATTRSTPLFGGGTSTFGSGFTGFGQSTGFGTTGFGQQNTALPSVSEGPVQSSLFKGFSFKTTSVGASSGFRNQTPQTMKSTPLTAGALASAFVGFTFKQCTKLDTGQGGSSADSKDIATQQYAQPGPIVLASTPVTMSAASLPFAGFSFKPSSTKLVTGPGGSSDGLKDDATQQYAQPGPIVLASTPVTRSAASSVFAGFSFKPSNTKLVTGPGGSSYGSKDDATQQYAQPGPSVLASTPVTTSAASSPFAGFTFKPSNTKLDTGQGGSSADSKDIVTRQYAQPGPIVLAPTPVTTSAASSSFAGFTFRPSTDGDEDVILVGEKKATPEQIARAERLMLPPNFYLYEDNPPCPGCVGCEEGDLKIEQSSEDAAADPGQDDDDKRGNGLEEDDKSEKGGEDEEEEEEDIYCGASDEEARFIAAKPVISQGLGLSGAKPKDSLSASANAGAPVLGSTQQDTDDNAVEVSEYDPHYEPIMALPDKVDVVTGEEGEDIIFKRRAKLYRWDAGTKAWKERGVGDMKILQNLETRRARILMRRKQVLKVCANHRLSPGMKLEPMLSSDRAWVWLATDFAEEDACHEKFAIKFKLAESAAKFKEAFDKMKMADVAAPGKVVREKKELESGGPADDVRGQEGKSKPPGLFESSTNLEALPKSTASAGFGIKSTPTFGEPAKPSQVPGSTISSGYKIESGLPSTSSACSTTFTEFGVKSAPAFSFGEPAKPSQAPGSTISNGYKTTSWFPSTSPACSTTATGFGVKSVSAFSFGEPAKPSQAPGSTISSGYKTTSWFPSTLPACSTTFTEFGVKSASAFSFGEPAKPSQAPGSTISSGLKTPSGLPLMSSAHTTTSTGFGIKSAPTFPFGEPAKPSQAPGSTIISGHKTPSGLLSTLSTCSTTLSELGIKSISASSFGEPAKPSHAGSTTPVSQKESHLDHDGQRKFTFGGNLPTFSLGTPDQSEPTSSSFSAGSPRGSSGASVLSESADLVGRDSPEPPASARRGDGEETPPSFAVNAQFSFHLDVDKVVSSPPETTDKPTIQSPGLERSGEYYQSDEREELHFEPVVTLPEVVELGTGEEDEEIRFTHRAKLYRWDSQEEQWKERGVGDIKVLYHPETRKYRIVMRREQVLKVCANHFITRHIDLKPKSGSYRSWVWHATDASDGVVLREQLAVRFETDDAANEFKEVVETAKEDHLEDEI